jgi:GTP-binding protein HflX
MTDDTMSVVSWIHDNANVHSVDYGDQVVIEFAARPAVVQQSRAKAGELVETEASV